MNEQVAMQYMLPESFFIAKASHLILCKNGLFTCMCNTSYVQSTVYAKYDNYIID